jgi:hypothetical protein
MHATVAFAIALPLSLVSAAGQAAQDELDPETRDLVIEQLAEMIEARYIFPDIAEQIGDHLRERHISGAYDNISDADTLAGLLTGDLRAVNDDRHLGIRALRPQDLTRPELSPEEQRRLYLEDARRRNYGFRRVEILDDNIGFLDLRSFDDASLGGETAVAAMNFLGNVDALIVDLRQNGGGNPSMIQLLNSYFFEEPTHLNSFEHRGEEKLQQFWTLTHVPGKKLIDTPIFVLTSARTFSAAEEFTYNLKHLKRATIIGETTGGGAHPGGTHVIEGRFSVFIPDGRAVNPITGTNWEGVGVKPHVAVAADDAFEVAREQAVKALQALEAEGERH